jgi:hypothetical protein
MRGRFILLICCLADIVAAAAPGPNPRDAPAWAGQYLAVQ